MIDNTQNEHPYLVAVKQKREEASQELNIIKKHFTMDFIYENKETNIKTYLNDIDTDVDYDSVEDHFDNSLQAIIDYFYETHPNELLEIKDINFDNLFNPNLTSIDEYLDFVVSWVRNIRDRVFLKQYVVNPKYEYLFQQHHIIK